MTNIVTQTCTQCGADIYGTNFCENCGTRAAPSTATAGVTSTTPVATVGEPSNGKARASLTMALIGFALNALSTLLPSGVDVAITVCAVGLLIAAIVVGHLARREIRATGQRGAGLALAGMLIGYIIFVISIAALLAVVFFTAAALANL